jgi:TonB family protein
MKSVLALATIVFALSLCNLIGRRANTNENANSRQSGTASETSASPSPALSSAPRPDTGSAAPPSSQSGPQAPGSSKAGVPSSVPGAPPPPSPYRGPSVPRAPISGGVLNGKAIRLPQPAYPPIAKAAHASGAVNVQVTVDETGNVISAHAVSGHPLLKSSAEAAARQARFSPTVLSGQPVKVTGIIVYNFVMQ